MSGGSIYKHYIPAVRFESDRDDVCYWFVFCQNKLLISTTEASIPRSTSLAELNLSPVRVQYLGTLKGHACYSAELPPDVTVPDGMTFHELRSLYGVLEDDMFLLAGKAIQIVTWDETNQYCGRCGHETQTLRDERAKKCPACGLTSYPRISPAVITAVLKGNKILLSHNAGFKGDMHSLIAGFIEPGEDLEECLRREISEEVGVRVKDIRYFGSQPWPFPNSLMIGFIAEHESGEISVDGKEISKAGWFDVNDLPELPPKMSIARKMIDWFIRNNS